MPHVLSAVIDWHLFLPTIDRAYRLVYPGAFSRLHKEIEMIVVSIRMIIDTLAWCVSQPSCMRSACLPEYFYP